MFALKPVRFFAFVLVCVLLLTALPAWAADSAAQTDASWPEKYNPGLDRASSSRWGYSQARELANDKGVKLKKNIPLYKPKNAQPLNAYMVTHPSCDVGIDRDGMYKVSQKGLIQAITDYLEEWMDEITEESRGAIRFVRDPDQADILISACQTYKFYANYSHGSSRATGYSCTIKLEAYQLSNTSKHVSLSAVKKPERTVRLRGGGKFWELPPELKGTSKLTSFVDTILGWYGYKVGASKSKVNVKAVRQALQKRGFMAKTGNVGTAYDNKAKAAVQLLQKTYGLKETGKIDKITLIALYYDRDAVEDAVYSYPK